MVKIRKILMITRAKPIPINMLSIYDIVWNSVRKPVEQKIETIKTIKNHILYD
jgi:hypothetical protein